MVAIILSSFFNCVSLLGWVYQDSSSSDTRFEVFGPRADKLLIKLYASAEDEWNALVNGEIDVTDSLLTLERYEQFTNTSLADQINSVESPGGQIGLYLIDINNNNNEFLGNPPDPAYPNPVYPNPCSVLGMRKAVAYLCNRTHIVEDLASQFVFGSPAYSCVPPTSPYSHSGIAPGGSREDLCYLYSRTQANASLDASGFSTLDSEGWRMWDTTGQRVVLKFFIRNETLGSGQARFLAGNFIADELEACGVKIERIYGPSSSARACVMSNKDFHLYTAGWSLGGSLDFLIIWNFKNHWHPGMPYNYDGCNNPEFNSASDIAEFPTDESSAVAAGIEAQEVFAEDVLSVPLWTTKGYLAMNRRYQGTPGTPDGEDSYEGQYWEGVSPSYLDETMGIYDADNCFTFLNMHPQGYPFGNGEMTIRYGLSKTEISSLNPIYAEWAWDNKILNLIGYESLLKRDPYNYSNLSPWIAKKWQVGTSPTNTNVSFSLRTDVCWSDGVPLTAEDVRFTLVELPRILSGRGFAQPYWDFLRTNIVDFRITDPYNFEIMLNGISYWNALLAALCRILPEHVWRPIAETGDPTGFQPDPNMTATGPWKLEEFVEGDHLLLVPNPSFFKKEPIDCIASVSNPGVRGQVVSNGTNVEFNVTILNQCYGDAANATVRVYVDSELLDTVQVTVDNMSSACLGPFLTGQLMSGLHVVRIECTPTEPAWLNERPSQYEMPVYVTDVEDVNLDYYTNIQDAVIVCRAFASVIGDSAWDPKADIAYDYKIDAKDVIRIMSRASKREWPAPAPEPGLASIVLNTDHAEFAAGETFNLTVMIENAIDLAGYQFTLSYNTSAIDLISAYPSWLGYQNPIYNYIVNDTYSESVGKYYQSCTTLFPDMSFSGSDLLATLTFNATQTGSSFFSLTNTLMVDSDARQIPHTTGYEAYVYIMPSSTKITLGVTSSIDVMIDNVADLYGFEIKLGYNTTILNAINASEGSFLKQAGSTFVLINEINDTEGYVKFAVSRLSVENGVNGSGTLFTLAFNSSLSATGTTSIAFNTIKLSNPQSQPISHTFFDGSVGVVEIDTKSFLVVENETTFNIPTVSNSTILELNYNESDGKISLISTGPSGYSSFCNITIPKELLNGTFVILVNGQAAYYEKIENATHYTLCFNFTHSTVEIDIFLTLKGDLNGDRKVNIYDIVMIASAYGSKPEDPHWNPIADLVKDGEIDIFDAVIVCRQYGSTWP